ncbi:MAG: dihydropteroate synthase [Planctomycetaceae bacterium]|nr:MAG: dihydropteroate synthase [Planctomycetaceae bacterium]
MLWKIRGRDLDLLETPKIMGILNVTPDSFSDGGCWFSRERALDHAEQLVSEGADILDVGGESTRPGAAPVPLDEELRRVIPVIEQVAVRFNIPISVDTYKAEVAKQALQAGAHIVNDISGLRFDPNMVAVCAEFHAGVVCMHIQGTPQTMQQAPMYDDVVRDICAYFRERESFLIDNGVTREQIVWDPGIGFGKTAAHNLELLTHTEQLLQLGRPILIGHSRKRFLKHLLRREVDERLYGTLGISLALAHRGIHILRVHDVRATRDALIAYRAIMTPM